MSRPLVIDQAAKDRIATVRTYAEDPKNLNVIAEVMAGSRVPPGDKQEHVTEFQFGFRAVYSVDLDRQGLVWRHLSVSLVPAKPGRAASPEAVQMIAEEFGFHRGMMSMQLIDSIGHAVELLPTAATASA